MTRSAEHLSFEVLNDHLDGTLNETESRQVEEHIANCSTCAREYADLRHMLRMTTELPDSVLPDPDVWPELKQALESRKEVVLPVTNPEHTGQAGPRLFASFSRRLVVWLAAAAVLLIALSSSITAYVLRSGGREIARPDNVLPEPGRPTIGATSSSRYASFRQTESEYTRTIDELRQAVETQRGQLSPETIRTVDRSLAVVDSAIAEARAALLADPNNGMLVDLLASTYQRKLDLLRRTSELGSRT